MLCDMKLPATIAETFAHWSSLELDQSDTSDEAGTEWAWDRYALERHALTLPADSAADVWMLVAMTTDRRTIERARAPSEDFAINRAHDEAARLQAQHGAAAAGPSMPLLAGEGLNGGLDPVDTPARHLMRADDALAEVQDLLELLFMAGEGIACSDRAKSSAIVRGAMATQRALAAAREELAAAQDSMEG